MRKLILGLAILIGLAVVVDFGAAAYSEYRVSRALREGGELSSDPEVTIHGFPFITQAIDGKYKNIEIRAQGVRADLISNTTLEATLNGVSIPASDLIEGKVHKVPVDHIGGRLKIDATELGQLLGIPDLQVSASPADKSDGTGGSGGSGMTTTGGGVVLTGTVTIGPFTQKVSVKADLVLDGNQVKIAASDFYTGGDGGIDVAVPEQLKATVLGLFDRYIDTRQLPFGVVPTKVSAQGSQIVIEGEGDNVTIDIDQLQRP
ncbi:LmeA family phospholipid-binding protein [Antrihabitans cavernicola]|uniref:DUF2993 domain-containing protein n=1 Tax=Antrihabitans cavernicola TaxID=2495913 RepID=A0A5A7SC76_9NOCA|nr:LmeA family phospholipid-binding protein [Spelaeibacter cavernicola]KAA0021851.1 DUF2993 domain-containing protein [Spelaeibacter cavernicola]